MKIRPFPGLLLLVLLILAGCTTAPATKPAAVAIIGPASGSQAAGQVSFTVLPGGGLHVEGSVTGLTPGAHGFHIHEVGDCSAPDATSAKGHFNPYAKAHGSHGGTEHHAGDMPNLVADATGKAAVSMDITGVSVGSGDGDILRRSVVIHADPDDYRSQPAGNSGKRVACGVIVAG